MTEDNTSIVPSRPYQKEFARLEVQGAFTSKRKLLRLVRDAWWHFKMKALMQSRIFSVHLRRGM